MWMREHPAYVLQWRPAASKEGELNWEQHLADDPQWFAIRQIVQGRSDPTFDGVLDRHQCCGDVAVTDSLEGLPDSRVRSGFVGQCGQRQQRLVGEGSDGPVLAIVVWWYW